MDAASHDVITRVDRAAITAARAGRRAENYVSSGFQLLVETNDAANARLAAQAAESREFYVNSMAQIARELPEKASMFAPLKATFAKAFAACDPILKQAASATTVERQRAGRQATQRGMRSAHLFSSARPCCSG